MRYARQGMVTLGNTIGPVHAGDWLRDLRDGRAFYVGPGANRAWIVTSEDIWFNCRWAG